jgi:hypothetical protein
VVGFKARIVSQRRWKVYLSEQGCQIFLGTKYQNGKILSNYHELYQMSINITKDSKMDQVTIKYSNIFHWNTLQDLPKFGFLVWKQTIWQPCLRGQFYLHRYIKILNFLSHGMLKISPSLQNTILANIMKTHFFIFKFQCKIIRQLGKMCKTSLWKKKVSAANSCQS